MTSAIRVKLAMNVITNSTNRSAMKQSFYAAYVMLLVVQTVDVRPVDQKVSIFESEDSF